MESAPPYPTRAEPARLFETHEPDVDPEGLISRFLASELHRLGRDAAFALRGSLVERLRALHWYLCDYARTRSRQIPLSRAQIAFLNRPMPLLGCGIELSIAAHGFIAAEFAGRDGRAFDCRDEEAVRAGVFWWVTQRSLDLAPGGELVTPAQVLLLKQVGPGDGGRNVPLNAFVRRSHACDPALACLNLDLATDRALLVAVLMLRCGARPFLAQFLPEAAVAALLAQPASRDARRGAARFDRLLALALGQEADAASTGSAVSPEAAELRRRLEDRLSGAGFAFAPLIRPPAAAPADLGACHRTDPALRPGLERGVAVIGPARAVSGLGQATRLSLDVLARAGYPPAAIEFGMDNPAPVDPAAAGAPRLQVPRRINLFHLNPEFVPLAFAQLDRRIYENSYNIGYVFWELDRLPQAQRLGLDMLDEIWVASDYVRETYARALAIPVHAMGMAAQPLPAVAPMTRARLGLPEDAFVYLATFDAFSFIERKNPLGTIAAFQAAYPAGSPDAVALILKTQNRTHVGDPYQRRVWDRIDELAGRDPRIHVIDRTLAYEGLLALKGACDCYVSLHRSEGWGFGLVEAMQLRLPVIATAYSGNMDFCSPETAFLVDHELTAVLPEQYIYVPRGSRWADPSTESAAAAMRAVRGEPALAARRVEAATRRIEGEFGPDAIARRYRDRLAEIERICDDAAVKPARPVPDPA